jgi:hypothetical protein
MHQNEEQTRGHSIKYKRMVSERMSNITSVMPKMMETGACLSNKSIRSHYFVGEQNVRHTANEL